MTVPKTLQLKIKTLTHNKDSYRSITTEVHVKFLSETISNLDLNLENKKKN